MNPNKPELSIVIVTWNNEKDIETCLESLRSQSFKNFNIIVVDNNSNDSTKQIVRINYPEVDLIENKKNKFLTGGNNQGIMHALNTYEPNFVMVLNPDTKASPDLLDKLIDEIKKDSSIGAVGPKVKFFNNSNEGLINSAGINFDGFMQAYDRGFMQEDLGQFDNVEEVFGVTGACILYRVEMLKQIGFYWERIKLYLDEVELFIRAKKFGWKVKYVGKTTLFHSYMRSSNLNKDLKIEKQKKKAWLLIALRHFPSKSKIAMLKNYFFNRSL